MSDTATVSTLKATVHLGAHADAPCHYIKGAKGISESSLDPLSWNMPSDYR